MRARTLATVFILHFLALGSASAWAGMDEGIEYFRINPPQPTSTGNKVEVLEAFSYGCPHCYHFEPEIEAWKKQLPANTEFVRFHVIFDGNPGWEVYARAFYTAETLDVVDKVHKAIFDAIHEQKINVETDEKMADLFAKHGIKKQDYLDTAHSFTVDSKIRRARELTRRYGVDGVPTMIVNGKFRTSARYAGSNEAMLKLVTTLAEKEAKH